MNLLRDLFTKICAAVFLCLLIPGVAVANRDLPLSAKIFRVDSNGANFDVYVHTESTFDSTTPITLRLLDGDGNQLASTSFTQSPGIEGLYTLTADPTTLVQRGWQHVVELHQGGNLRHRFDVRLQLRCSASGSSCFIHARPGIAINRAVNIPPDLAAALDLNSDFSQLAANPALKGAAFEAAVDLMGLPVGAEGSCLCFYTADISNVGGSTRAAARANLDGDDVEVDSFPLELDHHPRHFSVTHSTERLAQVGFSCYSLGQIIPTQLTTPLATLTVPLPTLLPCPNNCSAPVTWRLRDLYEAAVFKSVGLSKVALSYEVSWVPDGTSDPLGDSGPQVLSFTNDWQSQGTQIAPFNLDKSFVPFPTTAYFAEAPSASLLESSSTVELNDWSRFELPFAQVAAGATLEALGTSSCAAAAEIRAAGIPYLEGSEPTVLRIEVGPDEEDP